MVKPQKVSTHAGYSMSYCITVSEKWFFLSSMVRHGELRRDEMNVIPNLDECHRLVQAPENAMPNIWRQNALLAQLLHRPWQFESRLDPNPKWIHPCCIKFPFISPVI